MRGGGILHNLCHRGVDFQSFCDPDGPLISEAIRNEPEMKKRGKQARDGMARHGTMRHNRQTDEMRWDGSYTIFVTEVLTFRASAILVAPSAPKLQLLNLR
jgi:hypothetical protein